MNDEMEQPKKLSLKKDKDTPSAKAEESKSKLQADLEKQQAAEPKESAGFKMPVKGIPSAKTSETVLHTEPKASSEDIASVMAEFERVSAELKIAAEKAAKEALEESFQTNLLFSDRIWIYSPAGSSGFDILDTSSIR